MQQSRKEENMAGMKVEQYVVGPVMTNCYFAINEDTSEMLVIDPGDEGAMLIDKIKEKHLIPKAVLLTHGHFDHAGAAKCLQTHLILGYMHKNMNRQRLKIQR